MIAARKPLDTTSEQCRKSPPKTTTLSPNGESGCCMMSRKVWSIASAQCRCCAEASSALLPGTVSRIALHKYRAH